MGAGPGGSPDASWLSEQQEVASLLRVSAQHGPRSSRGGVHDRRQAPEWRNVLLLRATYYRGPIRLLKSNMPRSQGVRLMQSIPVYDTIEGLTIFRDDDDFTSFYYL